MKAFLFVILASSAIAQDLILSLECPINGNPSPAMVTRETCESYTACEFTEGVCHMKRNNESGYLVSSDPVETETGFTVDLVKADLDNTLYGADIENLVLEVVYHENHHVQIKIYDPAVERYEIPFPLNLPDEPDSSDPLYRVSVSENGSPLVLSVLRNSNDNTVWRSVGPLTFEDQFIQISTQLASSDFYGLGEHFHTSLRHNFDYRKTYPIFTRDEAVGTEEVNIYGAHPYYMNVEDEEGYTHSTLLYNSNAMEFSTFRMSDSSPALTIRTIGGILDFHFFLGPNPQDVYEQYADVLGKNQFPPYWALGFQLSKWDYGTIDNYRVVHDRMKAAEIPWDIQYFDSDYMVDNRDFTYDPDRYGEFPEMIQQLHDENMKVVLIVDPAIAADWDNYAPAARGRESDVFIKWMDEDLVPDDQLEGADSYVLGYLWPTYKTVYPDFLNPDTQMWWANEIMILHEDIQFDGLWIDMNEPSNFGTNMDRPWNYPEGEPDWSLKCPNNSLDRPPYETLAAFNVLSESLRISDKTLCMSTIQTDGENVYTHYNVHSLYGYSEIIATHDALVDYIHPEERAFVLTRSSFPGSGNYGMHWLGDNSATWEHLAASIIGILEFNMFAIPFVGADVCGFYGEPDEELCIRWMQLGAFYPFDRNHNNGNDYPDQDPARPGWDLCPVISRDVLLLRYKYLPYMYARLHRAHMNGRPLLLPLFAVFPDDLSVRGIDDEFFWSTDVLVAPVLQQGATSRSVYFPEGLYYDVLTGVLEATGPTTLVIEAPIERIPAFVRGGSILPFQEPALTTTESRENPFGITIALNETLGAVGEIFWDDGTEEHIMARTYLADVTFAVDQLTLAINYNATAAQGLTLENVVFYGFPSDPSAVSVNGDDADASTWNFEEEINVLALTVSVPLSEPLDIQLTYD